jgi:hypothetical protein
MYIFGCRGRIFLDKGNLFRPQQFRELSTATIQEEAAPRLPKPKLTHQSLQHVSWTKPHHSTIQGKNETHRESKLILNTLSKSPLQICLRPSSSRGMSSHTNNTDLTLSFSLRVKGLTGRWYVLNGTPKSSKVLVQTLLAPDIEPNVFGAGSVTNSPYAYRTHQWVKNIRFSELSPHAWSARHHRVAFVNISIGAAQLGSNHPQTLTCFWHRMIDCCSVLGSVKPNHAAPWFANQGCPKPTNYNLNWPHGPQLQLLRELLGWGITFTPPWGLFHRPNHTHTCTRGFMLWTPL